MKQLGSAGKCSDSNDKPKDKNLGGCQNVTEFVTVHGFMEK